jgi:hypothetical protein
MTRHPEWQDGALPWGKRASSAKQGASRSPNVETASTSASMANVPMANTTLSTSATVYYTEYALGRNAPAGQRWPLKLRCTDCCCSNRGLRFGATDQDLMHHIVISALPASIFAAWELPAEKLHQGSPSSKPAELAE